MKELLRGMGILAVYFVILAGIGWYVLNHMFGV